MQTQTEIEIERVMADTGMDFLQAKRHVESRNNFIVLDKYNRRKLSLELERSRAMNTERVE